MPPTPRWAVLARGAGRALASWEEAKRKARAMGITPFQEVLLQATGRPLPSEILRLTYTVLHEEAVRSHREEVAEGLPSPEGRP